MRLRDLFETKPTGTIKPLTPAQTRKRADRQKKQQERISIEKAKSAARIREIQLQTP